MRHGVAAKTGTRFGLLRHIAKSPRMLVIMLVAMLLLMAVFMMMW